MASASAGANWFTKYEVTAAFCSGVSVRPGAPDEPWAFPAASSSSSAAANACSAPETELSRLASRSEFSTASSRLTSWRARASRTSMRRS
ncbi:MAG: hypothetical protein R2717_05190 [Schumannella sp.]